MFRILFTIFLSVFMTPVFAADKLIPAIYGSKDLAEIESRYGNGIKMYKNVVYVTAYGSSLPQVTCSILEGMSKFLGEKLNITKMKDNSELRSASSKNNIFGYRVSTETTVHIDRKIKTEKIDVKVTKDARNNLHCSRTFIGPTGGDFVLTEEKHKLMRGPNLLTLNSKRIRVILFGVTEDSEWIAVVGFKSKL